MTSGRKDATSSSEIVEVEAVVLRDGRDPTEFDPATETLLVRLTDEAGRVGIGETDGPSEVVRDLVLMDDAHAWSRGLRGILLGRDPFEIRALHADLYQGTIVHGRRGLGIQALSAVDVALHDLAAKQVSKPVYSLLGGACRDRLHPYATLYPGLPKGRSLSALLDELQRLVQRALDLGFRAMKIELGFEEQATDRQIVDCVGNAREMVGADVTLMADFGYRWSDWREALRVLQRLDDCELYFVEAVLDHDDIEGHAKLGERISTRLCGAEWATSIHECREWIERGHVDVLQPGILKAGGLTELRQIADLAALHGVLVVPQNWKTGINAAATRHLHAATPNIPLCEWLSPELWGAALRRELVSPEPQLEQGTFALPDEPGLGITVNEDAVERYRVT